MPEIEPTIPDIENATPEIEPATPEMENAIPEIEPAVPELHNGSSKMVFKDNVLFGKYDLGKLLGCGAFSKVYHARSIRTGQSVAVKVIIKKKIAGTTMVSNIKREITIMRRLRHPNIVRLHEVLATYTKIYFVMELVKGGELFAKVAKGRFTEDLARKYFRQLISAIGYCHARGVCHRDLKPENLLIDENGDLKVCDFVLSAVKEQVRPDGLLHTLCGTPAYVAPDILTKTGYDGAKVDVWSCGIILYVLTVGSLPFDDPNLMSMYRKICKGEFKCPRSMSSDLKKFLPKLINTNSNKRITIDEITEDPWFTKGEYEKLKFLPESEFFDDELKDYTADDDDDDDDDEELKSKKRSDEASCSYSLNAFDLISFSPGLDLSGLVNLSRNPMEDVERFLSKFSAQMILEKIEALAVAENLKVNRVTKRDRVGIQMVGQNGNFVAKVEIGELIEELVVVEVTRKAGDALSFNELWKKKIRLELDYLVYGGDDNDDDNGNEEDNDGGNESVYGDVF